MVTLDGSISYRRLGQRSAPHRRPASHPFFPHPCSNSTEDLVSISPRAAQGIPKLRLSTDGPRLGSSDGAIGPAPTPMGIIGKNGALFCIQPNIFDGSRGAGAQVPAGCDQSIQLSRGMLGRLGALLSAPSVGVAGGCGAAWGAARRDRAVPHPYTDLDGFFLMD